MDDVDKLQEETAQVRQELIQADRYLEQAHTEAARLRSRLEQAEQARDSARAERDRASRELLEVCDELRVERDRIVERERRAYRTGRRELAAQVLSTAAELAVRERESGHPYPAPSPCSCPTAPLHRPTNRACRITVSKRRAEGRVQA